MDEDDPETYVNNDEKRTELDYERKMRNIEGLDKDDGVGALRYQNKMEIGGSVFKDYVNILIGHGIKNKPGTHICLTCWSLISSSHRG